MQPVVVWEVSSDILIHFLIVKKDIVTNMKKTMIIFKDYSINFKAWDTDICSRL